MLIKNELNDNHHLLVAANVLESGHGGSSCFQSPESYSLTTAFVGDSGLL
jgi:hypothetical protein